MANLPLKIVLLVLLLAGCGPADKDARLLCSLEREAFFMEYSTMYGYRLRRVPSADQLCPHR